MYKVYIIVLIYKKNCPISRAVFKTFSPNRLVSEEVLVLYDYNSVEDCFVVRLVFVTFGNNF